MKAAEDVYTLLHFLSWWLVISYKIRLMHKIQYGLVYTMLPKKKYVSNVLFYQQLDQIYCILTNQSRYNLYHCSHSLFLPKAVNLFSNKWNILLWWIYYYTYGWNFCTVLKNKRMYINTYVLDEKIILHSYISFSYS